MSRIPGKSYTRVFVLIAFASLFIGFMAGYWFSGEWKPVGDGASIVHSRTGEIRKSSEAMPDLSDIAGTWIGPAPQAGFKKPTSLPPGYRPLTKEEFVEFGGDGGDPDREMLTIGPRSMVKGTETYAARVIDAGENWWFVELQRFGAKHYHRIELSENGNSLSHEGSRYTKFRPPATRSGRF